MSAPLRDLRFLLMAPTHRDADITGDLLNGAGIETQVFSNLDALVDALNEGAAAVLVAGASGLALSAGAFLGAATTAVASSPAAMQGVIRCIIN